MLHQAAIPSVQRSVQDPMTTNEVNVRRHAEPAAGRGTPGQAFRLRLVVVALRRERDAAQGRDDAIDAPISPYGLQKLAAESYCRLYHSLYGLPTVALRYFNVFGPRQDPSERLLGGDPAVHRGRQVPARRATIYGDGEQTRDFTYIDNVVQANLKACEAGESAFGRAYNIGCGERISLNELVRADRPATRPWGRGHT